MLAFWLAIPLTIATFVLLVMRRTHTSTVFAVVSLCLIGVVVVALVLYFSADGYAVCGGD